LGNADGEMQRKIDLLALSPYDADLIRGLSDEANAPLN